MIHNPFYLYNIEFKYKITNKRILYEINMLWPCHRFYHWVLQKIRRDFEISNNNDIYIINADKSSDGIFDGSNRMKLSDYFEGEHRWRKFYIYSDLP